MRKINRSFLIAWSIIAVLVFANVAVAATTVGTSIETAGSVTTTGTGALVVAGTTTLTGLLSAVNASISANLDVIGDLAVEDVAASASATIGTTLTVTGLSIFTGGASVSNNFEVGSEANAFRVIGSSGDVYLEDLIASASAQIGTSATIGTTLGVTGLTTLGYASASGNFEVGTNDFRVTGSNGDVVASGSAVFGYSAASGSGFVTQFVQRDNTVTLSVDFDSGNGKGSCLQLRDTAGALIYCRVNGGGAAFTCSTTTCK